MMLSIETEGIRIHDFDNFTYEKPKQKCCSFPYSSVLLTYNWHTALHKFEIYDMI